MGILLMGEGGGIGVLLLTNAGMATQKDWGVGLNMAMFS
jgi:hypothetical protein